MLFEQKYRDVKTFGELKKGDTFILKQVQDVSVDPDYCDCVCLKIYSDDRDDRGLYILDKNGNCRFKCVNLTYDRIEEWVKDDTEVELVSVKLVEI